MSEHRATIEWVRKGEFKYDAHKGEYVCPEGKALAYVGQSRQKRSSVELVVLEQYRAAAGECANCPRKQECRWEPCLHRSAPGPGRRAP